MTTQEYIKAVKVKIDEISPYDEPTEFIAGDSTDMENVKPIVATIKDTLPKSAWFCLSSLPVTLLSKDAETDDYDVQIDCNGIGHIDDIDEYVRFVRMDLKEWKRSAMGIISSESPFYQLQQNFWTRGKKNKPVVVYVPEHQEWELYSFDKCCGNTHAHVQYIPVNKNIEKIKSEISDFIVLRCAAYVQEIFGDTQSAQTLMAEYTAKLQNVLQ